MTSHVDCKRAPARKSPGSAIRAPFENCPRIINTFHVCLVMRFNFEKKNLLTYPGYNTDGFECIDDVLILCTLFLYLNEQSP